MRLREGGRVPIYDLVRGVKDQGGVCQSERIQAIEYSLGWIGKKMFCCYNGLVREVQNRNNPWSIPDISTTSGSQGDIPTT